MTGSWRPPEFATLLDPEDPAASALAVESAGFDYVTCGEHLIFHRPTYNSFVLLAAAAAVTTRVRLANCLVLSALYPPVLLAKLATTLERVANGRYALGVGVGGDFPPEFEAAGVPVAERGFRTEEAVEILRALWSGTGPVSYEGRAYHLSEIALDPPPLQRGGPEIWMGGRSEAAMRRAGRVADVWLPYMYSPEMLASSVAQVSESAARAGRQADVRAGIFANIAVDSDSDRARRTAAEVIGGTYRVDFSKLVGKYAVAGTPEECRQRLEEYRDAGASLFVLPLACRPEERRRMLELVASEILPAFRDRKPVGASHG